MTFVARISPRCFSVGKFCERTLVRLVALQAIFRCLDDGKEGEQEVYQEP